MLDVVHRQHQFKRVLLGLAAELAAVVGEHGTDVDADRLVERQDAVDEQFGGGV
jgi:hypothetical protein